MSGKGADPTATNQVILGAPVDVQKLWAEVHAEAARLKDLGTADELRRAVKVRHASVAGNRILISELVERVRRIEQHLGLSPTGQETGADV